MHISAQFGGCLLFVLLGKIKRYKKNWFGQSDVAIIKGLVLILYIPVYYQLLLFPNKIVQSRLALGYIIYNRLIKMNV